MKILIFIACLGLMVVGTYLIHWLFNAKEWVDYYIKKVRPELSTKAKKGSKRHALKKQLKKRKVVLSVIDQRSKMIEFLAKDKPHLAPFCIYFVMGSCLILVLMGFFYLGHLWLAP